MSQPNPWILFMGGIALLNVAMMAGGLHAPAWVRVAAAAACAILGLVSMGLGLHKYFQKKPERSRFVPRRSSTRAAPPSPRADARRRGD
jgi:hypothetical protein